MSKLDWKISEEEREFELTSSDFFRPPLKQIGNSIYEIKTHFMCKDAAKIIPGSCSPHQTEMRDTLLRHLEEDSFLYQKNIVTGFPIGTTSTRKPILSSFAVLVDSFPLAIDFEVSPRPGDVLCDILLAVCGQPVIVLTVVDEDKNSRTAIKYNTSVARGVTTTFRTFMDESINVVFGVLSQQDLVQTETFSKSLETFGINSSMFVTACTLETSPSKYEKIVTAFWAGVAETRSVISRDGRVDTDYLRFLTKDQCIILMENINNREVEVQFESGTGATTLMVEVARRLSRLNETLLVCRSQKEKERLKSVYPNTETVTDLRMTDLSKYTNIVDETGTVTGPVSGKLWSFTKVYSETEDLQNSVEMTEKQNANTEKMIFLLSSADRRDKMNHLLSETEILELFDINFQGLLSAYLLPSSLVHEVIPVKHNPDDEGDRNRRLETEDYMRHLLDQLKRGIDGRQDLFPLLSDMMKQVKGILPYLQAKADYLQLATSDNLQAEDMKEQTSVFIDEGLPSLDHEKYEMLSDSDFDGTSTDSENETASTKSPEPESEDISPVQGGKPEVPHCSDDISEVTESKKIQKLQKKLKLLKKEADGKQQELMEVRGGTDHGVEWEYNMDCLSQNLAKLKIKDVITDVIGEDEIPVTTNKTVKSSVILGLDSQDRSRRRGMRRSQAHQLRKLQYGTLRRRDLFDIMRNVITDDQERLTNLRTQSDRLERVYGSPFHMVGEINTDRSGPVSCPPMTFNRERVHEYFTVSGDGLEMVSSDSGDHHDGQYRNYWGTCSRLPIPLPLSPSTLTVPQYWETHSRVQVGGLYWHLLEMGLCGEGEVDTERWVFHQTRSSWSVMVGVCDEHYGYYCTKVWENGRQVGGCRDTVSLTPGTHLIYKWGIALDMGRGRLAFLDVKRGRVLHRLDIKVDESLVPMFSVLPFSGDQTNMRLVSGSQLPITDTHKHLIAKALYSP